MFQSEIGNENLERSQSEIGNEGRNRQRESRVITLSLAYKFGDTDKSKDRKKRRTSEPEGGDDSDF